MFRLYCSLLQIYQCIVYSSRTTRFALDFVFCDYHLNPQIIMNKKGKFGTVGVTCMVDIFYPVFQDYKNFNF